MLVSQGKTKTKKQKNKQTKNPQFTLFCQQLALDISLYM